jgi:hypothetical protein
MEKKRPRAVDPCYRLASLYPLLFTLLIAGGCGTSGPETYPVSGTVTFNGTDLPEGYITFTPQDAAQAPDAGEIKDGRFAFRAKAGPKKVEIQASRPVGPENPIMGQRPQEQYIPEKYNVASELTAEVTADGENEFQFSLSDEEP